MRVVNNSMALAGQCQGEKPFLLGFWLIPA